uniref:Uncharacterized protein n=1 Tax=Rhizophora mucronata TaxID=61149 RepID=A0A2P2NF26_RHIMU
MNPDSLSFMRKPAFLPLFYFIFLLFLFCY